MPNFGTQLKLDNNKANLTVGGHLLDNLPVPSMPWCGCLEMVPHINKWSPIDGAHE